MASTKARLKAARDAIAKKDFPSARAAAQQALDFDPDDYHAFVFFGLSSLELEDYTSSEQAYKKATELKPDIPLAWQGLCKFYEQTQKWDECVASLQHLATLYSTNSADTTKCAETVQKIITLRRNHGSRTQLVDALKLLLHGSPVFDALSGLPPPDPTNPTSNATIQEAVNNTLPTLQEIVSIVEAEEREYMEKEIAKRRTRLGAPSLDILTKEVKSSVLPDSELPRLYDEISSHPSATDEIRRSAEAKLLRLKLDLLQALPISKDLQRAQLRDEVDKMIKGIILLGIPDELAWHLYFEWTDTDTIEGYGLEQLKQYTILFPSSNLSKILSGYIVYKAVRGSLAASADAIGAALELIIGGQPATADSTMACHVVAAVYLQELDYPSAVRLAHRGLTLLRIQESAYEVTLSRTELAFNSMIGVALVYTAPPKFHRKALPILNDVLRQSPNNVACLLAKSSIHQAANEWREAASILESAIQHSSPESPLNVFSQEELAWSLLHTTPNEGHIKALEHILARYSPDDKVAGSRCAWRIGQGYWQLGDGHRADAYRFYINALKADPTFAPAFTSLGKYYLDAAELPDSTRALKCFQKAVELDAREATAAEYLAMGFADENAWNLVEVIARRVVEGEKEINIQGYEIDDEAQSEVAWAWKAIGVVEFTNKNYNAAIQAFQTVLRSTPDDHASWLYLGEAYHKAGRHTAALNSASRALELKPDDWICLYLIGQIKQQALLHSEAIDYFQTVLKDRPKEVGVIISKAQSYLDLGRSELVDGFFSRAATSFIESIKTALLATGLRATSWKIVGDALIMLTRSFTTLDTALLKETYSDLAIILRDNTGDRLKRIYTVFDQEPGFHHTTELAIAVYDHRRSLGFSDAALNASASYDYAIALIYWMKKNPELDDPFLRMEANTALTQALKQDPSNDLYWATLGDFEFRDHAKVSQHAYIKSLEFNPKNAGTWVKLGLLYLHHGDTELALEALRKAHVLDPEFRLTWVAEALVAEMNGNLSKCYALFKHSLSMKPNLPLADLWYAAQTLKEETVAKVSSANTLAAFFTLGRYIVQCPGDAHGLELYGLVCERLGLREDAVGALSCAISILETAYEESESREVESQYAMASSNLARVKLSIGDYEGAVEAYNNALGLLPEDGQSIASVSQFQSSLGCALACHRLGDFEAAVSHMESAVKCAGNDSRLRSLAICSQGQVLWVLSTPECREHAKTSLLECISDDAENLTLMQTLATMGILTSDESLIDAAISEILNLTLDKRRKLDPKGDIDHLLIQSQLSQENALGAIMASQRAVMVSPTNYDLRRKMATLMVQCRHSGTALSMLAGLVPGLQGVEGQANSLTLSAIASTLNQNQGLGLARKAVMLAPWKRESWMGLLYAKSMLDKREGNLST